MDQEQYLDSAAGRLSRGLAILNLVDAGGTEVGIGTLLEIARVLRVEMEGALEDIGSAHSPQRHRQGQGQGNVKGNESGTPLIAAPRVADVTQLRPQKPSASPQCESCQSGVQPPRR